MNSEKLKTWLNFSKFFLGTFVLGAATVLVNYHIQSQEVLLKAEEVKLKKEEFNLATLEKTREIELAELKSLGAYIDHALVDNVAKRRRFSQYFATVTRSPELRERWKEYDELVEDELKNTQTQLTKLQSDLQNLEQVFARTNADEIVKQQELEREIVQLTAKLEETQRQLRIESTTLPRKISVRPRKIAILSRNKRAYFNMLCCAIKRNLFPDKIFAITPTLLGVESGSEVRLMMGTEIYRRLGIVLDIHGTMENDSNSNFDAMLIEVEDDDLLEVALGGARFLSFAKSQSEIPASYWLLSSDGPIRLLSEGITRNFTMFYPSRGQMRFETVLQSLSERAVNAGSGGAPIASEKSGGKLLGMFIASGGKKVFAIPAWQLFRPENYVGMTTEEKLTLHVPSIEPSTDRSSE